MSLPELLEKQARQLLDKFCDERVPCERYQGLRLSYRLNGNHVTLFEEWLDPDQLFGSPEVMKRSAEEVTEYADFASLHQTLLSEYILRSPFA